MAKAAVVHIDPNKLFREGLSRLFADGPFEVVGGAATSEEALPLLAEHKPDIVLVEIAADPGDGSTLSRLREAAPDAAIVVLTTEMSPQRLGVALAAGVDGYVMKDLSPQALERSLALAQQGEKVLPTQLAAMLITRPGAGLDTGPASAADRKGLSAREHQILRCLVNGDSNKAIANQLGITEATVKVHLKSLLRKINASNRTQAAIWALDNGIGEGTGAAAA